MSRRQQRRKQAQRQHHQAQKNGPRRHLAYIETNMPIWSRCRG